MSANETTAIKFINQWLQDAKRTQNNSVIAQAICNATQAGGLDEARLLKNLRELAKPNEEKAKI